MRKKEKIMFIINSASEESRRLNFVRWLIDHDRLSK